MQILLTLLVGLLGGLTAKRLRFPAPFIIGSMLAVGLVSVFSGQMTVARPMRIFAQIISGAYIGQQVTKEDLGTLPKVGSSILSLMALFTLNMLAMGLIFIHGFGMNPVTAFLSCLPGGIMDVSLMSIDMGAQADVVATLQTARLVGILLILPVWVSFIVRRFAPQMLPQSLATKAVAATPKQALSVGEQWRNNAFILSLAAAGGLVGFWLGLPVGALIASLLVSAALKITRNTHQLSSSIRYMAQVCAGSMIGTSFTRESLVQMGQLIIPVFLLLASYMVINAFFGYVMYKRGILDLQSALFASSPAGATDISLLAGELGGDLPKIAGIQISRILYTVIIMPFLVRLLLQFF